MAVPVSTLLGSSNTPADVGAWGLMDAKTVRDLIQAASRDTRTRWLNATPEPIARGTCDHAHREDRYIPSRMLKHLTRARTARCPAPGCGAQAATGHIDHTKPYRPGTPASTTSARPAPGTTTLSTHPGWTLEQPRPGIMRWTTPSGRTYTTHPTQYDE